MKIGVTVAEDVRGYVEGERKGLARALRRAITETTDATKAELRAMTEPVLGAGVARAWRSAVYPRQPRNTLGPASQVFTRAPTIVEAFAYGATIRPVNGSRYLWIPTPAVPRRGRKRMSPGAVEERFGDFIYIRSRLGGGSLIAAVDTVASRKTGRIRAGRKVHGERRRGNSITAMFVLVRQVRLTQRIDLDAVADRASARWAAAARAAVARREPVA